MTTLLFIKMYQDVYYASMENNRLIIESLMSDWLSLHLFIPFYKIIKVWRDRYGKFWKTF